MIGRASGNSALNDRILLGQAKGVLAERTGLQVYQVFDLMRDHAREHGLRLCDVAAAIIAGGLTLR